MQIFAMPSANSSARPGVTVRLDPEAHARLQQIAEACAHLVRVTTVEQLLQQTPDGTAPSPLARLQLAQEMVRVTRPGGWLTIFDFAISHPLNPNTIGIRKGEIRRLFAGVELVKVWRLFLPLPLLRRLPGWSLEWLHGLEGLLSLCATHRLYLLRR